jgi:hypothetical protein
MGEKIKEKGDCGKSIARIVPRFFSPAIGILCIFIWAKGGRRVYPLIHRPPNFYIHDGSALGYRLAPNHWSMIISSALYVFFPPSLFDLAQKVWW